MDIEKLELVVIDALEDIKGQDIQLFDATPLTGMFDRVVVVSGTSNRQTRGLAKHLHDSVKKAGGGVYGTEGDETGEWILVDLGDIIVHIMQPSIREYYRLEEIWGAYPMDWKALQEAAKKAAPRRKATAKKPIKEKKDGESRSAVTVVVAPEPAPATKKKSATKTSSATSGAKSKAKSADKPRAAAKRPAPKAKPLTKKAASSGKTKPAAKPATKSADRKPAARPAAPKRPTTKTPAAKKPAAKR